MLPQVVILGYMSFGKRSLDFRCIWSCISQQSIYVGFLLLYYYLNMFYKHYSSIGYTAKYAERLFELSKQESRERRHFTTAPVAYSWTLELYLTRKAFDRLFGDFNLLLHV